MTISFSAPSKTFLTGEYAVLAGGPALILATEPRFELRAHRDSHGVNRAIRASGEIRTSGIPNGSPAYKWLEQRSPLLSDWNLEFIDPHGGRGGFGASGAQFVCVHAFTTWLQSDFSLQYWNAGDVWRDYKVLSGGEGSGADILAQTAGGVALVDVGVVNAESRLWPFLDLSFAIVRTGVKVATHEHLRGLDRNDLAALVEPARQVIEAFENASDVSEKELDLVDTTMQVASGPEAVRVNLAAQEFVRTVNDYAGLLERMSLLSPTTRELLEPIRKQSWCLSAKGCGAFGADTIALLFTSENKTAVWEYCQSAKLEIIADSLSEGLKVQGKHAQNEIGAQL